MENYKEHVLKKLETQFTGGNTVWQRDFREGELKNSVPYNPVSGQHFSGVGEVLLRNTAIENGYADPRWMTAYQAYQKGWKLKPGAEKDHVTVGAVQYDSLTKRTVHKYHTLYNAEVIEGIPARDKVRIPVAHRSVAVSGKVQEQISRFCASDAHDLSTAIARNLLAADCGLEVKNAHNAVSREQLKDFFKCYTQALQIKEDVLEPKIRERQPLTIARQRQAVLEMGY